MAKIKPGPFFLLIIILAGFFLRLWGIGFGLPYQLHQDESIVVNHAVAYGSGDFNPHFFAIPPFVSYLLSLVYGIYFILLKLCGYLQTMNEFALSFFKDPSIFYVLGRIFIGVIPGTLSIALTYSLYKHIFVSLKGALFAAAVVAFSFLNVLDSHFIYVDTMMVVLVILTTIQLVRMNESPTIRNYMLLGIVLGIAIGTKYNAAILAISFLMVHLGVSRRHKLKFVDKKLISALLLIVVSFCVVNPFAVFDFASFVRSVHGQGKAESYVGWLHHIVYSLREGIGGLLLLSGGMGLVLVIIKERLKNIFLIIFPTIFYLHLVFFSQPFSRYVLPLIPFFAVWSAYFIFEYLSAKVNKTVFKIITVIIFFLIFTPLIIKSVKANVLFTSVDTRILASEWIKTHIRQNAKIAVDHTFFRPAIFQNREQLMEKHKIIVKEKALAKMKRRKIQFMLDAFEENTGYYIYFLSSNPESQGQFMHTMPSFPFDLGVLQAKGVEFVVINYANRKTDTQDFYEQLKSNGKLIMSFSPYKDGRIRMTYDSIATTCMPVLSKELFTRSKSGPALEIYQITK